MTLLEWRPANKGDAHGLAVFECAEPPRSGWVRKHESKHAKPWEYEVQSHIRARRHKCKPTQTVWVGADRAGIGAVFRLEQLDGAASVLLAVAAIAMRHRRLGGGVADELVRTCLDEITAQGLESGEPEVVITARIDKRNHPSQKMARRNGFTHTGMLDEYQVWQKALLL